MILRIAAACLASASTIGETPQIVAPPAADANPATIPAPAPNGDLVIPAKSIVEVEITEQISSKINNLGDTFTLKLAEPFAIAGGPVLPAGLSGRGEVTHAAKRGWGGKAGELIINARYLECGDLRIPLGHFRYAVAGKSNVGGAFATAQVIPFGQFLVSGQEALIPPGSRGTAQVTADVTIKPDQITKCVPSTTTM